MDPASCEVKVTFYGNRKEPESEAASHHKTREFPTVYTALRPALCTCKEDLVNQSCWFAGLLISINVKLGAAIIVTSCTPRYFL